VGDARTLVFNVGSSSFKWALVDGADRNLEEGHEPALSGSIEQNRGRLVALAEKLKGRGAFAGVGHRIVHGGPSLSASTRIDEDVRRALDGVVSLDPLHARPALEIVDLARAVFAVPHVAVFDTQFHATIPPDARAYALPTDLCERLGIRKYGFHGISVAYAVERATELLGHAPERLVVAHLGSGSSITAVHRGASVDTTMGLTPLDGLTMATRPGSLDPGVLLHVLRAGMSVDELARVLDHESGLAGMTGTSGDLREVRRASASGDERAKLAYAQLVRSWCRSCGAMIGSLGGLDALVFTGGIGEHDAQFRADAVASLGFLGLQLDERSNVAASSGDRVIAAPSSRAVVLVITAREEVQIAREVRRVLCS
jgi:acetate kinase